MICIVANFCLNLLYSIFVAISWRVTNAFASVATEASSFSASALAFTRFTVAAANFTLSGGSSNVKSYLRVATVAVSVAAVGIDRSLGDLTRHKSVGQLLDCRRRFGTHCEHGSRSTQVIVLGKQF